MAQDNLDMDEQQLETVTNEAIDHMMNPRNYGQLKDAQGIGVGADEKTGEFAMVYVNIKDDVIDEIKFGANACQDTIVAGSLFTEIIKGDSIENSKKAVVMLDKQLENAPKKQQACSRLVLRAYEAALVNRENKLNGEDEEMFTISVKDSCAIED